MRRPKANPTPVVTSLAGFKMAKDCREMSRSETMEWIRCRNVRHESRRPVEGRCSNLVRSSVPSDRPFLPAMAAGASQKDARVATRRSRGIAGGEVPPSGRCCDPFEGITKDLRLPAHVVGPHIVDAEAGPLDES